MRSSIISSTTFFGLINLAHGLGSANVKNQCSYDVYLQSVSEEAGSLQILAGNGGTWSQSWQLNPDGGGLSIKMSNSMDMASITQFEYTVSNGLWYDISNINGYPFEGNGLSVVPSSSECRIINCPSTGVCSSAYNQPDDNEATAYCDSSCDMSIVLCPENDSGSSSLSSSSPESQVAPQTFSEDLPVATPTATITAAPSAAPAVATNVNVFTTFTTLVVTLEAGPDGSTFFDIDKRDAAHVHGHRNVHRGNHARYHHHAEQE